MTSLLLASRTVRRYRAQTLLAIVGVAVIGALLFDMLLLSRGLLLSFGDLLNRAGFDIRVVGGAGMTARVPIDQSASLVDAIRALPDVDKVSVIRIRTATMVVRSDLRDDVTVIGADDAAAGGWTLVSGADLAAPAAPATPCPLLVGGGLASRLGIGAGSSVQLIFEQPGVKSVLPPLTCRIVGTGQFAFGSAGDETVATTLDAFHRASGESAVGDADVVLVASRGAAASARVVDAIHRLRPGVRAYSNDQVVEQFNRNGFAYFQQISFVLSAMTMAFAFMLVATLLTVSVNQRLGEIAALRAIGIRRGTIASMLMWESALLVGAGGLLALPLGELLAQILDRILRQMPGLPEQLHFFVFEPRAVVIHAAVFAVTAVAAAAYPIWLTTRLAIAATLRREVVG